MFSDAQGGPRPEDANGTTAVGTARADSAAAALAQAASLQEILSPHATLIDALERGARLDAPFLTLHLGGDPEPLGARAALDGAHRYAAELGQRGIGGGDRVLIMTPTSAAFVHAFLGTMLAGAVPVPLASPMTLGGVERFVKNLAAVARGCGARCLIASARILRASSQDKDLAALISVGLCSDNAPTGAGVRNRPYLPALEADQAAFIQYTSGTTGQPKGAVISHRAVVANAYGVSRALGLGEDDVGASWLPLFHDMGLIGVVLTALCHPYPVHVTSPERFLMSPVNWLSLISKYGATVTAAPNFAYDLCASRCRGEAGSLRSLRAALNGAEPVQPDTLTRFHSRFAADGYCAGAQTPVYGMAENTLAVTFSDPGLPPEFLSVDRAELEGGQRIVDSAADDAIRVVSVGVPVAGVSVCIADAQGHTLAENEVGEVRISGASLMDGYFRDDVASEAALGGGRLHSGDLGFMRDGKLYITGRAKEVIIKGGRNIYPYDIERVAGDVEGVVRGGVMAAGRPNAATGTDDVVVYAETRELDPEVRKRLERSLRGELLAVLDVKADEIHLRPAGRLPRTTSGKLKRAPIDLRPPGGLP